ncbi:hypothetical protein N7532_009133 [Penicillium argentinense]|uniref:F-box domain-containing protein n=1 Tax=Penicillium argentinense TaxID=1131581 RepID=A0A9W9K287_9EURO|nr:uncharacterized protein N7532_009133 [Penicillium argentinense]KAJ5090449.1 hypothetical protein N7532_009133 [Penicillium argentinense]
MELKLDTVLAQFRYLPKAERMTILYGILDQLGPHEYRAAQAHLNNTFQYDILGNLPLEIVAQIAEYLNLGDVFRLLRVSRHWDYTLSSPIVLMATVKALGSWVPDLSSIPDPYAFIRRRFSIERGLPAVNVEFNTQTDGSSQERSNMEDPCFSGGNLAWKDRGDKSVHVLNLWTGHHSQFTTENRDTFGMLGVSDSLVAAITLYSGFVHVWHIATQEHVSFRLPNSPLPYLSMFLVCGTTVAVFFDYGVVHWRFDTRMAHMFNWDGIRLPLAIDTDPHENNLVMAYLDSAPLESTVHVQKLELDQGVLRSVSESSEELSFVDKNPSDVTFLVRGARVTNSGQISAEMEVRMAINGASRAVIGHVAFEKNLQLTTYASCLEHNIGRRISPSPGVLYASSEEGEGGVYIFQGQSPKSLTHEPWLHKPFPRGEKVESLCGDENFSIFISREHVRIWSFDETWVPDRMPWSRVLHHD